MAENLYLCGRLVVSGPDDAGTYSASMSDGKSLGTFALLAEAIRAGREALGLEDQAEAGPESLDQESD